MTELKPRRVGNSVGFVFTQENLAPPQGGQMVAGRPIAKKRRNGQRELAK